MAEEVGSLKVKLSLDGADFTRSMASIDRNLKALGQEMRINQNKGKDWGRSLQGLTTRKEALGRLLSTQEAKVRKLNDAYQKAVREQGANSVAAENLAVKLNKAQAEYQRTETELKDVNAQLAKMQGEVGKTGTAWDRLSGKMKGLQTNVQNVGKKMQTVGGQVQDLGGKLTRNLTGPAVAAAGALASITLVKGFNRLVGIDTAQAKLKALGNSAEDVELVMTSALDSVRGTSFGLAEAATTAANAVAAGIEPGQELTKYLKITGDAAAVAGVSMQEMGSIINKVETAQRAYTGEINQLADRGIPIYQWLADEIGTTVEGVREMASEGKISSETFLKAIEDNIGGAAKIMGEESFAGAIANVGAAIGRIGANFLDAGGKGGGFFSTIKPLITDFREQLEKLEPIAKDLGVKFGEAFNDFIDKIKDLKTQFDELDPKLQAMIGSIAGIGTAAVISLGPAVTIIGLLIRSLGTLMLVLAPLLSPIGLVIGAIALLGVGLYLAYTRVEEFRLGVNAAWEFLKTKTLEAFTYIKGIIQPYINEVVAFVQEKLNIFKAFWQENGASIVAIVKMQFSFVVAAIKTALGIIQGVFQMVWPIIANTVKVTWETIKLVISTAINLVLGIIQTVLRIMQGDWKGAWNTILDTVKNIWADVGSFLENIDLAGMGRDIIQGLINGIKSMGSSLITGFRDTVKGGIEGAKNFLGIRSPSRLTMAMGEDTGEGFAMGIEDKFRRVKRVAEEMSRYALPNVNGLAANYQVGMNAGYGNDTPVFNIQPAPIYIDGRRVAQATFKHTTEFQKTASTIRNNAGGRYNV